MLKKTTLLLALVGSPLLATAQTAPGAPTAPTAASGPSTPAKRDLVARILKVQQPAIEALGRNLAEQPAAELTERAGMALPERVAPERREAVAAEIRGDVKKYLDEAVPLVQGRAVKLAPTTIGSLLEEKFTEDELRQVVAIVESPAYSKFQQLSGQMQTTLGEKLLAETRAAVEPKVLALEQSIARRLGITPQARGSAPAAPARAPARPASR
jgi:hypothetical protein